MVSKSGTNKWYIVLNPYFAEYLSTQAKAVNRAIELVQEALNYANSGASSRTRLLTAS